MPKVIIRGERDPIVVTEEQANAILEKKNDPAFKGMVEVDGRQVSKSAIKEIRFTDDKPKGASDEEVRGWEASFRAMEDMARSYPIEHYGVPLKDQSRFPGIVLNPVLGGVHWSIVQHAMEQKMVRRHPEGSWSVCGFYNDHREAVTPAFDEFMRRLNAVRDLKHRREYAQKINTESRNIEVPPDSLEVKVEPDENTDNLPF